MRDRDIAKLSPEELLQMQRLYEAVVRRHARLIRRVCLLRSGGDMRLCEELEQEVSIGLWLHLDSYRPGKEEAAWVYWRARKVIHDFYRHRLPSPTQLSREIADTLAEETCNAREQQEDIMAHLSDEDRRLLELRLESEGVGEMAAKLHSTTNAIYKRMRCVIEKARMINDKLNER